MSLTISPAEIVATSKSPLLAKHPDWPRVKLGEVATVVNGAAFESRFFNTDGLGLPLVRIRDVGRTRAETFYSGPYEESHLLESGDLLIGMDGEFRIAEWHGNTALLNQRVCKLVAKDQGGVLARYLLYVLPGYLNAIHAHTSSVTVKHLSSRTVLDLPIPLPPLDVQRAIVEEIETHFTRLDAGSTSLGRAQAKLRRYRASLLQSAATGALVGGDGWPMRTLESIAEIRGGILKNPKRRPKDNHFPFLRVANVLDQRLDLSEVHRIELFEGELDKWRLLEGDLLVVEGNGSPRQIGRMAIWHDEIPDCVHQNHLVRARPYEALSKWVAICWNSPMGRENIRQVASSTSGLYTLSAGKVAKLEIPVPPPEIQQEVVAEVDRLLSVVDTLEMQANSDLKRLGVLRTSILSKTCSGEPLAASSEVMN